VMMLLALSFIFGPLRSVTMGARVLTGICFGFVFYGADQIFGPLSLVYHVPAVIGAAFPSVLFLGLSWYLLTRRR
ncbi:MAG: LptF/LptG family permease, partial [Plesiomonas shigelloides]